MKNINHIIAGSVLCIGLIMNVNSVSANTGPEETPIPQNTGLEVFKIEETTETYFGNLADNEKVLELPDGGYIFGTGTINVYDEDGNIIETYDVENDPHSVTVKEAKQQLLNDGLKAMNEDDQIIAYSGAPATKYMVLELGHGYQSNPFNAIEGWRFAGYNFKPASGTGSYLRWGTFKDSGRVFVKENNPWHGTEVYPIQYYWISCENSLLTYATFSPIQGTYYTVANVEP